VSDQRWRKNKRANAISAAAHFARVFFRDTSGKEQYLLAQREARASEARSGTRRGDCETATTKRVKRPKRYPTEARSRGLSCKRLPLFVRMFAMAFSGKVEFGLP
jgi:hypothetical protein